MRHATQETRPGVHGKEPQGPELLSWKDVQRQHQSSYNSGLELRPDKASRKVGVFFSSFLLEFKTWGSHTTHRTSQKERAGAANFVTYHSIA